MKMHHRSNWKTVHTEMAHDLPHRGSESEKQKSCFEQLNNYVFLYAFKLCLKPFPTNNLINKLVKSVSTSFSWVVFVLTGKNNCMLAMDIVKGTAQACMLQEQLLHINTTLKQPVEYKKTVAQLTLFVNRQLCTRGPMSKHFGF